jgi:ABC-type multidrug transport system fused ATPase/permease subunit
LARKGNLKSEYLGVIKGENDSRNFLKNILGIWDSKNYKIKANRALIKTLLRANIFRIIFLVILSVIVSILEFLSVVIVKEYIDYFQEPHSGRFSLIILALALSFSKIITLFIDRQSEILKIVLPKRASLELSAFIYDKILKASPSSHKVRKNQGEIINNIQLDTAKVFNALALSPNIVTTPILILLYIYLLFKFFGFSFMLGMIILCIIVFISYRIHSKKFQEDIKYLSLKDKRMKLVTEAFESIKLLKLYNWEKKFMQRICDAMKDEAYVNRKVYYIYNNLIFLFWLAPVIASVVTIGIYQLINDSIKLGNILIGLTIFNTIQPLINDLPNTLSNILEAVVSVDRIEVVFFTLYFRSL